MKNADLREYAKYTSSSIIAMIGLSCYILADTFFISLGLGEIGLAALNISCPSFNIVFALGMLFGVGGATKYAIHRGANEKYQANKVFTHTVFIICLLSVLFVLLGIFLSKEIAIALGADEITLKYSKQYVQIILCFAPFFMFNTVLQNFVRNDGAPRLAMIAMLLGNLFNIVFDYVFIFPCKLGMLGAALATGISPIISILILSTFILRRRNNFNLTKCKPSIKIMGGIAMLGTPSFLSELASGIMMLIFNKLLWRISGNTAVAAFGIIINVAYVVNAIMNGVAQGAQPIISFNYGNGNYKKIKKVLKYALITISVLTVLMYVVICAGAEGITKIFNSEGSQALQQMTPIGLRLFFLYALVACFNILFANYFSASNKALYSQIIIIVRCYLTVIPLSYLFANAWGVIGLWLVMPVSELVALAFTLGFYFHSRKTKLFSQPAYIKD